jgi:TRAP-type C4-dicarboxylate transport system substrate-binding protein
MSANIVGDSSKVEYAPLTSDGVTLWTQPFEQETEITGPVAAKVFMSSQTTDADLFLITQLFDPNNEEVTFAGSVEPEAPIAQGWLRGNKERKMGMRQAKIGSGRGGTNISRKDFLRLGGAGLAGATMLGAVGCGEGGTGGGSGGENIRLTVGAGHPADGAITYTTHTQKFFVPELKRRVEEETNHTVEINEAYGGTIAELAGVLEATQDGLLDIGLVPYPFEPSTLFLHNVSYYVPFQSPDPGVVLRVTRQAFDANPEITTMLEEQYNQKLLAVVGWGDYNLGTIFEVSSVEDLDGRDISAAGPNLPWLDPVGATPVQGSLNEWYTSLQTGVIEGVIMFPESMAGFNLHEVAPYYTRTNFGAVAAGGMHVNLNTWDSLPEEVRNIIQELAEEYESGLPDAIEEDVEQALNTMEEGGATITELPSAERRDWAEALPNIPNQRAQEANEMGLPGTKTLRDYIEFMREEGYEFPREWPID